ncbi:uncharacterized protein LOC132872985 isoform X2 [Neoarius graeffei]|nr:uncharacterized protein LOC132872985 isoform X2 [Neoarius graeffei]
MAITKSIAEMIVKDRQPLSVVEHEGFKSLIKTLDPRYRIPTKAATLKDDDWEITQSAAELEPAVAAAQDYGKQGARPKTAKGVESVASWARSSVPATSLTELVRDFLTVQMRADARQEAQVRWDEAMREGLREFFTAMCPHPDYPLSHQMVLSNLLVEKSPRLDFPLATPFQPLGGIQQSELAALSPLQSSGLDHNHPEVPARHTEGPAHHLEAPAHHLEGPSCHPAGPAYSARHTVGPAYFPAGPIYLCYVDLLCFCQCLVMLLPLACAALSLFPGSLSRLSMTGFPIGLLQPSPYLRPPLSRWRALSLVVRLGRRRHTRFAPFLILFTVLIIALVLLVLFLLVSSLCILRSVPGDYFSHVIRSVSESR